MISRRVHKVCNFRKFSDLHVISTLCKDVHQVHPTIKKNRRGVHGFTILQTFYSKSSRRDFTGKCTHVHPRYRTLSDRSDSDADSPLEVTLILLFVVTLFFAALRYVLEVFA